jgi:hypothetical protein
MNIFVPFFVCPYDAFNVCEKGSNVWSWIIEHDDAHALLNDQGIFLLCFLVPNIKICITWSFLELFL